jgi:hypothetical protein
MENKRYILSSSSGDNNNGHRDEILPALLRIFKKRLAESFLSAACLFNLSFYEEGKAMLLNYIPPSTGVVMSSAADIGDCDEDSDVQSGYKCHKAPSDNEKSLLRVVEALLMDFTPYLQKQMEHELRQQQQQASASSLSPSSSSHRQSKPVSTVEAATTRWCIAMLRNLATVPENAQIIATTTAIPLLTAHCLIMSTSALPQFNSSGSGSSSNDLSHWARDSLEDSSLMLLLWLSQCGSQGLAASSSASYSGENNKPVDLDESIAGTSTGHGSNGKGGKNNINSGIHSVSSVEQQSALEALDLPVIRQALQGIQNKPGIHGVRAKVILQRMNEASNNSSSSNRSSSSSSRRATPPITITEQNSRSTPQTGHESNNNVRVIVNSNSNASNNSSRLTAIRNNRYQRQQGGSSSVGGGGGGGSSHLGVDTDVVQEIIKSVESSRQRGGNHREVDDDDDDRMRVDDITLASF